MSMCCCGNYGLIDVQQEYYIGIPAVVGSDFRFELSAFFEYSAKGTAEQKDFQGPERRIVNRVPSLCNTMNQLFRQLRGVYL